MRTPKPAKRRRVVSPVSEDSDITRESFNGHNPTPEVENLAPKRLTTAARMRKMYDLIDAQLDDFEGQRLDSEEKRILVSMIGTTRALMATEADMEAKYGVEAQSDVELAAVMRSNGMSDEAIVENFQDDKILESLEAYLAKDSERK